MWTALFDAFASTTDARVDIRAPRRGQKRGCMCYFPEEYRHARVAVEDTAPGEGLAARAVGFGVPREPIKGDEDGRRMRRSSSVTEVGDRGGVDIARDGACGARTVENREHVRSKSMEDARERRVGERDARRRDARDDDSPMRLKNYDLEMMMFGTPGTDYALHDDRMDGIGDSSMERSREPRRRRIGYMSNGTLRDVMRDNSCSALESIIRTLNDND